MEIITGVLNLNELCMYTKFHPKEQHKFSWSASNLCREQNKSFRMGCQSKHKIMVASKRFPLTWTNSVLSGGQVKCSIDLSRAGTMTLKSEHGYLNPSSEPF